MTSWAWVAAWALAQPSPAEIDALARATREAFRLPGLAVAVVRADRVAFLKGYGERELGKPGPVDADTVFPIASCTKPFTSLALATLIDDGTLRWDDPVRKHLPRFRLKDPHADALVCVRDLLCHRTGLAAHDLLWYRNALPLDERVARLGALDLAGPFRGAFQYQVIAFGAAGLVGERASGQPWERLITSRIIEPLGLTRTTPTSPKDLANAAAPHRLGANDAVAVCPRYPLDAPDPAGSIHSTARDLATFLRCLLVEGDAVPRRIVSADSLRATFEPQIPVPLGAAGTLLNPETVQVSYGLGWIVQDYRGKKMLLHGGSIDGFRSQLTLVPELGLGVALLNNLDGSLANLALACAIVDGHLNAGPRDWNRHYADLAAASRAEERRRTDAVLSACKPGSRPPLPLDSYVGQFRDGVYGDLRITADAGKLRLELHAGASELRHCEGHTFVARDLPTPLVRVDFVVADARVSGVRLLERRFVRQLDRSSPR